MQQVQVLGPVLEGRWWACLAEAVGGYLPSAGPAVWTAGA